MRAEFAVIRDEIEAHKAAMHQVLEEKRTRQKEMNEKKKRAIEAAETEAAFELLALETESLSRLAAMQKDFERLSLLRQIYSEAPNDVFELIVSKCSDVDEKGWGHGGLNAFRLANKRLKRIVESCATRLTNQDGWDGPETDGPDSLPINLSERCRRIEHIRCNSYILGSLEGCPAGLKSLCINGYSLESLEPLRGCPMLERVTIFFVRVSDPSPLDACLRLRRLTLFYTQVFVESFYNYLYELMMNRHELSIRVVEN